MAARPTLALSLALGLLAAPPAFAQEVRVGAGESLQRAIALARPGDVLRVASGVYQGVTVVTVPHLTLIGEGRAVLDGEHRGSVLLVRAPGVTVRGFEIRASGKSPFGNDAGVQASEAAGTVIEDDVFDDVLMGAYLQASPGSVVRGCRMRSEAPAGRFEGWGDGVRLWKSPSTEVSGNQIEGFRDGIYLEFSHHASISGNQVSKNQRYGLHFMYCDGGVFQHNAFEGNQAGCVLMYSRHLRVEDNLFAGNRGSVGQGMLFKENDDGFVARNRVLGNTVGMFMDGSNRNRVEGNVFAGNGWGLLLYASSVGNGFDRNDFYANNYPVAVDAPRCRNAFEGNYWSEYRGYDLDGDGRGDVPYAPVSMFAFLAMQYPDLYAFIGSPAVKALEFAQRLIPALAPSDLRDPAPAMTPGRSRA